MQVHDMNFAILRSIPKKNLVKILYFKGFFLEKKLGKKMCFSYSNIVFSAKVQHTCDVKKWNKKTLVHPPGDQSLVVITLWK
jgi:hypothetical protein